MGLIPYKWNCEYTNTDFGYGGLFTVMLDIINESSYFLKRLKMGAPALETCPVIKQVSDV